MIDKYMGDCIMAVWNAPLDIENQEEKAVASALTMLNDCKELNKELEEEGAVPTMEEKKEVKKIKKKTVVRGKSDM